MAKYVRRKKTTVVRKKVYRKRKSTTTMAQLAKTVNRIQRNFRPELKALIYTTGSPQANWGQVLQNIAGYYAADITPIAGQGTSTAARIGSELRIKSLNYRFQTYGQANLTCDISFKVMIFRVTGVPVTVSGFVNDVFDPNPFVYNAGVNAGLIDYNSNINDDYKGNYKLLASRRYRLANKDYANAATSQINSTVKCYFKTPLKISFDGNTNNVVKNQLIVVMLANAGNASATVASPFTGIPVNNVSTGMWLNTNIEIKYYDD